MKRISVIGGDRRQAILAELLAKDGMEVCAYGLGEWSHREKPLAEAVAADVVVLPLPLCWRDGILNCGEGEIKTRDLFAMLNPEQLVLAGQVKPGQLREAEDCGLLLRDYFLREEMTVANAAATAEAAIQVAMERLDKTLLGTDCLVLGFGRIGKLLSFRLHGLGGRVTATARKPADLAWIDAFGWRALETGGIRHEMHRFPVVFNTIPSLIINEELLRRMPEGCLLVDLASVQGVDETAAAALGVRYIWARGLPGKLVPLTAAMAIHRAVCALLQEREGSS